MIGDSNDETNIPHKLILTATQVSRLCKIFTNGSSANMKLWKAQLSQMMQLGEFLSWFSGRKVSLSLMKNCTHTIS